MTRVIRLAAVCVCVFAVLVLSGCASDGSYKSSMNLDVRADGSFEVAVKSDGELPGESQEALKSDGWQVRATGSGWKAAQTFKSLTEFKKPAQALTTSFVDAFESANGTRPEVVEPFSITTSTRDLFVAKRVEMAITMPVVDVVPKTCPECDGEGSSKCPECEGAGDEVCSDCEGDGTYDGYYSSYRCDSCDGYGRVECYNCDGSGQEECYDCDGTGEPDSDLVSGYESAVQDAVTEVEMGLPGVLVRADDSEGLPSWSLAGDEAIGGQELTASAWVVNWLYAGIAAAILALLLGAGGFLGVRRTLAKVRVGRATRAAAKALAQTQVSPAPAPVRAPVPAGDARFCPQCGSRNSVDAQHCTACGRQFQ